MASIIILENYDAILHYSARNHSPFASKQHSPSAYKLQCPYPPPDDCSGANMRVKLSRPYMHCCTRSIHSPAQNETQAFASIVFSWSARALMFHSRGGCLHEARKLLLNTLDANLANESLSYHEYASMLRKFDKHFKYELERL